MEPTHKQPDTTSSEAGPVTDDTGDNEQQNLNRMRSFYPALHPEIVESSSSDPFIPITAPENWRYSAGDGRDFLPKPKECPSRRIRDDALAPVSDEELSSTKLQRDDSPPPPPPLRSRSDPFLDGECDNNGEISYADDDFFTPPRGRDFSKDQSKRKVYLARSIGSDTDSEDDEDAGNFFPHRQGSPSSYVPRRKISVSRSVGSDSEDDGELFPPSLSWKITNGLKYVPRVRDRSRPCIGRLPHMRSCDTVIPCPQETHAVQNIVGENFQFPLVNHSPLTSLDFLANLVGTDSYKYESLDLSANQIRLIKLEAKSSKGITASLFVASLDNVPKYEALSYTWGNSLNHSLIHLDNSPFQVTQNLGTALENLQGSEVRVLWIDAICINQKDDDERSDQVSKMRTIYAQANAVIVWLGNHSQHSALAFSLLEEIDARLNDYWQMKKLLDSKENFNALQGLFKILSREYWWRIWVIQEVHFAPQITIHCGDSSIPWTKMILIQEELSTKYGDIIRDLSTVYPILRDLYTSVVFRGPTSLVVNRSHPSNTKTAIPPTLFEALLMHRLKHSTDPRDKIYALVGLTTARSDPNFQIDYSCSIPQVYIDTASYILSTSQTLDFLCAKTKGDEFPHDLPSWCPNWASKGASCPIPFRHATLVANYSASKTLPPLASIDTQSGTLTTKGLKIRKITLISPPSPMRNINDTQGAIQTLHIFSNFLNSISKTIPNGINAPINIHIHHFLDLLLGRTAIFQVEELGIKPLIAYLQKYQDLLEYWVIPPPLPDSLIDFLPTFAQMFFQRRLFVTEQGEVGLCENGGKEGDAVCILFGCCLPVLLRCHGYGETNGDTDDKKGHKCEFISDVLIEGAMDGEAIDEFVKGVYTEETFVLGGVDNSRS